MLMFSQLLYATEIVENTISKKDRCRRSQTMSREFPSFVPLFIKYYDSDIIHRNLVGKEIVFSKLLYTIRKKRNILPTTAIMSLIEKERDDTTGKISTIIVPSTETVGDIAERYKHSDGFLYISVCCENVFG